MIGNLRQTGVLAAGFCVGASMAVDDMGSTPIVSGRGGAIGDCPAARTGGRDQPPLAVPSSVALARVVFRFITVSPLCW